jgi:hypothetical protein
VHAAVHEDHIREGLQQQQRDLPRHQPRPPHRLVVRQLRGGRAELRLESDILNPKLNQIPDVRKNDLL